MPAHKGIKFQSGEAWSDTYVGFIKQADGRYRHPILWRNKHVNHYYTEKNCSVCGTPHLSCISNAKRNKSNRFFCSKPCKKIGSFKPDGMKKHKTREHGTGVHILERARNHPHAARDGFVPEHRLIMERMMGRYLLPEERVHHLNLKKDDNRPTNLLLCDSDRQHFLVHGSLNECVHRLMEMGVLVFSHDDMKYKVVG